MPRRTLRGPAEFVGVALHTGAHTRLVARPAAPGSGIVFRRVDLPDRPAIRAALDQVQATERRTAIGPAPGTIHTVEHLLAAVHALELDDVEIELDGPEPPILDGSFEPFVAGLVRAGIAETKGARREWSISRRLQVDVGDSRYQAEPAESLDIDVTLVWDHPAIGRQSGRWEITTDTFRRELAAARTFGLVRDVEALQARGLALGASFENAIGLDDRGVVGTRLRWPDEFVRHKAGDLVGDLGLLGGSVRAHIVAERPSHQGNVALARAIAAENKENSS